jgi:5-methylcytosine-specific restriction endonuclease McrA
MQKVCLSCGNLYTKNVNCSLRSWEKSKFCSRKCINSGRTPWNKDTKGVMKPNNTSFKKGDKRCVGNQNAKGHIPWNKGKSWDEETKRKISQSLMGRPTGRTGALSHFWKGGKSNEYTKLKNSIEWKEWRRQVFERDAYTCQECGAKNFKGNGKSVWIHPHHIKSRTEFPELQFEVSNGITLCRDCHRKTSNYGIKAVRRKGATS